MLEHRPINMAEVARRAGCHVSTVSLALRNDPRIAPATRARVTQIASELGYRINPLVAAWVSARRASQPVARHVSVAYLTCHAPSFEWKSDAHFRSIFEGARVRAQEAGFFLEEFSLAHYGPDLRRLDTVLTTRGVQGVIVGPGVVDHSLHGLVWERYALVTIGYALTDPSLHRVTEDHFLGMKLAFEACLRAGHRRIGLSITRVHNPVRRERWVGAYLHEQQRHLGPRERLPIYSPFGGRPTLRGWCQRNRPEVILADDLGTWSGVSVATLGFALSDPDTNPGVHENNSEIGRHAAELLIALVLRNARGIPAVRQTVLVEPQISHLSAS